jgi:hypothetical protein
MRGLRHRDQRANRPTQVWQKVDAIRAKQASKPKHSPLLQNRDDV